MIIKIFEETGIFAENKDIARRLRLTQILPALERKESITIDFENVDAATQSFIHALLREAIQRFGSNVLERIVFKGCNESIKQIIITVSNYVQAGLGNRGN